MVLRVAWFKEWPSAISAGGDRPTISSSISAFDRVPVHIYYLLVRCATAPPARFKEQPALLPPINRLRAAVAFSFRKQNFFSNVLRFMLASLSSGVGL